MKYRGIVLKYKNVLNIALIAISLYIIYQSLAHISQYFDRTEPFSSNSLTSDDLGKVLGAFDSIVQCEGASKSQQCNSDSIVDFVTFRRRLYPAFDIDLYIALLHKRKQLGQSLTKDSIDEVCKGFANKTVDASFHKTKVETFDSDTTGGASDCTGALQAFINSSDAKDAKYQADYNTWKNVTVPQWQQASDTERNALYAQWAAALKPASNEIIWDNKYQACGGGYGGCCNEAPEWQRKCECSGLSSGCGQCFGYIKYGSGNADYCKRYAGARDETVTPDANRLGTWDAFYQSRMSARFRTAPPEPPKPIYPALNNICQDCRQFQLGNESTDSKSVAIEQANTCIANIQKDTKAAADKATADKAAADKALADKTAADKAVANKTIADKSAPAPNSDTTPMPAYVYGIIGGVSLIAIIIIAIILVLKLSKGQHQ
jgi:hypothetical protein